MANKLYNEAAVQDIANAIRAKNGETGTMKISEMAAKINALPVGNAYREVWLHGPKQMDGTQFIDTGVAAHMDHTLEVIGYGNLYAASTLFGSVTSTSSRQVCDLLTSTMKWRFAWGNSGLKTYEYPVETISPWMPAKIRFNKSGFTVNGFTRSFTAAEVSGDYSASVTGGASTANYCIFHSVSTANTAGNQGVFRSAKIFDADGTTLLHHFVPIMYNDNTLAILDKVTNNILQLSSGTWEAYYAPYTDGLVGL